MTSFGILWGNWRSLAKPENFSTFVTAISVSAHASTLPRQQTLMFSGRHPRNPSSNSLAQAVHKFPRRN
jgi:hypothetical protein